MKLANVALVLLMACGLMAQAAYAQLDQNCTVSILNRTAQVKSDGSWRIDNIPSGFGPVRARATCVNSGVTQSGQSELFLINANVTTGFNANIVLGAATPIPQMLTLTGSSTLTASGQTAQLTVNATYAGGATQNVTAASSGTTYLSTNPNIASVNADGLVTAVSSGAALIRASNEGAAGLLSISVVLSGDADGDGIPDDVELRLGLNPGDPADAFEDPDRDGLSNLQESLAGADIRNPDTDGDGLPDGAEVNSYRTSPLLVDTDGDGIRDGLEIATGSDPTNPASYNLAQALNSITVGPPSFTLTFITIVGQASQQLAVTGQLKDNTTIDLTSTQRGTNYASSNLSVCNFGSPAGRVFGSGNGTCTITITNSGFTAQSLGNVNSFSPTPLSSLSIPGYANNVAVSGNFAFVAAGSTGLQVVNIANRNAPVVVASRDTPGNANGVYIVGNLAFVADGSSGLQIINIANPLSPVIVGSFVTPSEAWDVVVRDNRAYVAAGGLSIIDVSAPSNPRLLGAVTLPGTQKGVDVDPARKIAVLASGASGIRVIDVSNAAAPAQIGGLSYNGDARDVTLKGNFAFVADFSKSFTAVDLTIPSNPILRGSTPQATGGLLQDVAVAGNFGFGADVFFANGAPIMDISDPATPNPRAILSFANFTDDNGTGIAVDGAYVYLTGEHNISENGVTGNSHLYIGQYLPLQDTGGVAPLVSITAPAPGGTILEGSSFFASAAASDDLSVASVTFLVNGQPVFTDTAPPYEYSASAPIGVSSFTIGARAMDLGGNIGAAQDVVVNLSIDVGTTVIGRVLDKNQNPVSGAAVSTLGKSSTTGLDGRFTLPAVPTTQGNIVVLASATISGVPLTAASASFAPVFGGTVNVGDINFGSGLIVVAARNGNVATFLEPSTTLPSVVASLATGSGPNGVSITPDGKTALISNSNFTVSYYDLTTSPPSVKGSALPVGTTTQSTSITTDGRFAVSAGNGIANQSVVSFDIANKTIVTSFTLTSNAVTIAPNGTVLIADLNANQFRVLTISSTGVLTNTGVSIQNSGAQPLNVVTAPNGRFALAVNLSTSDLSVLRINGVGNVTLSGTRIPVCCTARGIAFAPSGTKAYVTLSNSTVAVLNIDAQDNLTDSGTRIPITGSGPAPISGVPGIAVSPDGTRVYVSNFSQGTISVIDANTNTEIGAAPVSGTNPSGVAVSK